MARRAPGSRRSAWPVGTSYPLHVGELLTAFCVGHSNMDLPRHAADRMARTVYIISENGLGVAINEDKSRMVDLKQGESFTFLGFEYRRIRSLRRKWRP